MRAAGLLTTLLVAGCNQVFGLEATISTDGGRGDFDHDGVTDDVDNCPTLANPGQENADGDAFGDACDTCPMFASASTHDEDGDHFGDDCDRCPGIPDFQDDTDNDGVGDLCDPSPRDTTTPTTRKLFEPFAVESVEWQPGSGAWTWADDSVAPTSNLAATDPGLRSVQLTTGARWTAIIGIESTTRWTDGDQFGLVITTPGHETRCFVTCTATQCELYLTHDGSALVILPGVTPRPFTRLTAQASAAGTITCGLESTSGTGNVPADKATLSLLASPRLHVTYFDEVE